MSHILCIILSVTLSTIISIVMINNIAKKILDFAAEGDIKTMEFCYESAVQIINKLKGTKDEGAR